MSSYKQEQIEHGKQLATQYVLHTLSPLQMKLLPVASTFTEDLSTDLEGDRDAVNGVYTVKLSCPYSKNVIEARIHVNDDNMFVDDRIMVDDKVFKTDNLMALQEYIKKEALDTTYDRGNLVMGMGSRTYNSPDVSDVRSKHTIYGKGWSEVDKNLQDIAKLSSSDLSKFFKGCHEHFKKLGSIDVEIEGGEPSPSNIFSGMGSTKSKTPLYSFFTRSDEGPSLFVKRLAPEPIPGAYSGITFNTSGNDMFRLNFGANMICPLRKKVYFLSDKSYYSYGPEHTIPGQYETYSGKGNTNASGSKSLSDEERFGVTAAFERSLTGNLQDITFNESDNMKALVVANCSFFKDIVEDDVFQKNVGVLPNLVDLVMVNPYVMRGEFSIPGGEETYYVYIFNESIEKYSSKVETLYGVQLTDQDCIEASIGLNALTSKLLSLTIQAFEDMKLFNGDSRIQSIFDTQDFNSTSVLENGKSVFIMDLRGKKVGVYSSDYSFISEDTAFKTACSIQLSANGAIAIEEYGDGKSFLRKLASSKEIANYIYDTIDTPVMAKDVLACLVEDNFVKFAGQKKFQSSDIEIKHDPTTGTFSITGRISLSADGLTSATTPVARADMLEADVRSFLKANGVDDNSLLDSAINRAKTLGKSKVTITQEAVPSKSGFATGLLAKGLGKMGTEALTGAVVAPIFGTFADLLASAHNVAYDLQKTASKDVPAHAAYQALNMALTNLKKASSKEDVAVFKKLAASLSEHRVVRSSPNKALHSALTTSINFITSNLK